MGKEKIKKMLEEYKDLQREVKMWETKIKEIENKKENLCADVVKGSMRVFPYTECSFHIDGFENTFRTNSYRRLLNCKRKFWQAKDECETKVVEIQEFIMGIEDSYIRQILIFRYIDEMNWVKIAHIMNLNEGCVKMIHKRFLEKS